MQLNEIEKIRVMLSILKEMPTYSKALARLFINKGLKMWLKWTDYLVNKNF